MQYDLTFKEGLLQQSHSLGSRDSSSGGKGADHLLKASWVALSDGHEEIRQRSDK